MDIKDLLQLAGLTNNAQPHSEDSLNHNEAETMRKLVVMIDPEQLNKIASTSEPDKMSNGCGCMEDEQVEEWANSGDHVSGTPEEMTTGHGELGAAEDTSLRRYLNANGANVKVDEHVYPDHKVEDIAEAYAAFKEGKYKSDAQRKAVHAAKDDKGVKEAAKPDYIDIDGDGDKKEPMKKAAKDKEKKSMTKESAFEPEDDTGASERKAKQIKDLNLLYKMKDLQQKLDKFMPPDNIHKAPPPAKGNRISMTKEEYGDQMSLDLPPGNAKKRTDFDKSSEYQTSMIKKSFDKDRAAAEKFEPGQRVRINVRGTSPFMKKDRLGDWHPTKIYPQGGFITGEVIKPSTLGDVLVKLDTPVKYRETIRGKRVTTTLDQTEFRHWRLTPLDSEKESQELDRMKKLAGL